MSMGEKTRHNNGSKRKESRVRSLLRKYSIKKNTTVINHIEYERHHGFESAKRGDPVPPVEPIA